MKEGWHTAAGIRRASSRRFWTSEYPTKPEEGSPLADLLKFEPGTYTTAPCVHDHWEEVYMMSGDS